MPADIRVLEIDYTTPPEENDVATFNGTQWIPQSFLSLFNTFFPIGGWIGWPSENDAPDGWLLCNGQEVSRTAYAALFAVVGTHYGVGDGSTTFNLPDFRGKFPLGLATAGTGSVLGEDGGLIDHLHTVKKHYHGMGTGADLNITASGSHTHDQKYQTGSFSITQLSTAAITTTGNSGGTLAGGAETLVASTHTHASGNIAGRIGIVTGGVDGNTDVDSGTANPPYLTTNFIIRTGLAATVTEPGSGELIGILGMTKP